MTTKHSTRSRTAAPATGRPVAKKAATSRSRRGPAAPPVDEETRREMIAQAAYFRARKRGFASGGELDDWLEAEREIARMLDN